MYINFAVKNSVSRTCSLYSLLALSCASMPAAEWYENVSLVIKDPFQFDPEKLTLFHTGLTIGGRIAAGKIYAIVSAATIAAADAKPNHILLVDSHPLTPAEANRYKAFFHAKSDSVQLPYVLGVIGSIPGQITGLISILNTLLDGLIRLSPQNTITASALAELMDPAGTFNLAYVFMNDPATPSHKYVSSTTFYSVKVGNQTRTYAISSATMPVKIN